MSATPRLIARYRLALDPGESASERALRVAHEQTVELPPTAIAADAPMLAQVVEVEEIRDGAGRAARAALAFDADAAGADLGQLLVLLFGNVSLQRGVRLEEIEWPADLLARFGGPAFGIAGLRGLCGVETRRALLCGVAKPLGASTEELARRCGELARGGADWIKDDHGIADPPTSPFAERVARGQEAIERANAETGNSCVYAPNLSGPLAGLPARVERLRALGVRAALVPPLALGLEVVRGLAAGSGLALLGHPSLAGAFFAPDHGIAPPLLLGDLFRLAGCDAVIYAHAGGRFPFSLADSTALAGRLRRPWGDVRPAFPIAAGGIASERITEMLAALGPDSMILLGSSLYLAADAEGRGERSLEAGTARLAARVREAAE